MPNYTNLEAYTDPIIYDHEQSQAEPQGPFYLALAQQTGGQVLELGCGTGRVTAYLAHHGVDIIGLDLVPAMLERARSKAGDLPIRWIEADARTFRLDTSFQLIYATTGIFQHLLERPDQEAVLTRIREHLAPHGIFAVDVNVPQLSKIHSGEDEQAWYTFVDELGREIHASGIEHYDPIRQIYTETAYYRWYDEAKGEVLSRQPLALRFFFPQELDALLAYNGFTILQRYGDWDGSPLTEESTTMIFVCTPTLIR